MTKNKMAAQRKDNLERRQEARLSELERKKQERAEQKLPEESPELLLSEFATQKKGIEKLLCAFNDLERSALREQLEDATKKLQNLQKFLTDSFTFLPSYDVKKMQAEINKLKQNLNEKRDSHIPKKKFTFSKKKKMRSSTNNVQDCGKSQIAQKSDPQTKESELSTSDGENNSDVISGQKITRQENDLFENNISFAGLFQCTLTLYGSPLALHLEKLESCRVFCGPVSGSVFINNCKDCVFVFPCQQLRVHNTVKSQFYLHITSRAIIEDSHDLGFTQFNWKYNGMEGHFETSRLDRTKNNWQFVDDFNWLKTEEHSPNWYIIGDADRVTSWD